MEWVRDPLQDRSHTRPQHPWLGGCRTMRRKSGYSWMDRSRGPKDLWGITYSWRVWYTSQPKPPMRARAARAKRIWSTRRSTRKARIPRIKNLARVRALRALDIRGETDRSDGITGEAAGVSIDRHWCEASASKSRRRCWRAASSGSGGVGAGEGKRGVTGERGK